MPDLTPGVAVALSPLVRRIVAPEAPGAAGPGPNTYLVGIDEVAVIDPGPDDAGHLDAIVGCGGDRIRWVLVTHGHGGGGAHGEAAESLRARTGAELLATLGEGDEVVGTEWRITVLHTPGHAPGHLCFLLAEERIVFSGDHLVVGRDCADVRGGDRAAWAESLERLAALRLRAVAPGHGDVIDAPAAAIDAALALARGGA